MEEIWKPLPECDAYEVSSLGRVKRVTPAKGTRANRMINPSRDRGGRMVFNVTDGGKRKQIKLHRAVASTFLGPCPEGYEVAHLDGNQENNALNNLKYATPTENNRHKAGHGTQPVGEGVWCSKLTADAVTAMRNDYPGKSYAKLALEHGVSVGSVVQVIKRRSWKHI